MRKLLLATRNKGKLKEMRRALTGLAVKLVSLDQVKEISLDFDVQETGKTFTKNAVLKAKTYGQMSGLLTLADDSGLEVATLAGRPGIRSARYHSGSDQDRCQKLLQEMIAIDDSKREARFVCAAAIFDPSSGRTITRKGVCQGIIIRRPKGKNGFGYDPIFFLPVAGKTMAQLTTKEKNIFSHRGQALKAIKDFIACGKIDKDNLCKRRKDKQKQVRSDKKTYNE